MLQGQLLDNSFTESKIISVLFHWKQNCVSFFFIERKNMSVLWVGSQYVTFLSLYLRHLPLTLTNHYFGIGKKSRIATQRHLVSTDLSNLTATKYWQFWKWGFSFSTNHLLLKSWNILVYIVTFWDPYPHPPLLES